MDVKGFGDDVSRKLKGGTSSNLSHVSQQIEIVPKLKSVNGDEVGVVSSSSTSAEKIMKLPPVVVENICGQFAVLDEQLVQDDTKVVEVLNMGEAVTGFEEKLNAIDKALSED